MPEMEEKCSIGVARQMSDHKLRRIDAFDIELAGPWASGWHGGCRRPSRATRANRVRLWRDRFLLDRPPAALALSLFDKGLGTLQQIG